MSFRPCFVWVLSVCALQATCAGTDASRLVTVHFVQPTSGTVYMASRDVDPNALGIQADLAGRTTGILAGREFTLLLDPWDGCAGTALGLTLTDVDGNLAFDHVTLPLGNHTLRICSADGALQSDIVSITVQG